jgi:AmiR/NasT family two-component response regulator
MADVAVATLLDGQERGSDADDGLGDGLGPRTVVFQAQGTVMIQPNISLADAMARIHVRAYAEDRPLNEVAADIVARRLRFESGSSHERLQRSAPPDEGPAAMTAVSANRVARVFVEVADTLVDEFDLIAFFQMLTARIADVLDASPVGLLIADRRGRLEFMAASDETVEHLELFQAQNQEGPCLDAYRRGQAVVNEDLRLAVDRWPSFAPRAVAAGYRSVHAFPMRLRAERIGALNVFSTSVGGRLEGGDVQVVQALADVASIGLLQERAIRRGEILSEQLQGALNSRIIVEQAKGALAQAGGITVDEAFERIRSYSRNTNQRLVDIARVIVTDRSALSTIFRV